MNHAEQAREFMRSKGYVHVPELVADGKLHRFPASDKRGDLAAWYCMHTDGLPTCNFGNWRSGESSLWCAKDKDALSPEERQALHQRAEQTRAQREQEQAEGHAKASEQARKQWDAAKPADKQHAYLKQKGITAEGFRQQGGKLLVPLFDAEGKLWSLQTIDTKGKKGFMPEGRVSACFAPFGKPDSTIVVCEGAATASTIAEATGHFTAAALSAQNLSKVAHALKAQFPEASIIVAADTDREKEGNPGLEAATRAARETGALLAVPAFGEGEVGSDFNDLAQLADLQAVRLCIDAASPVDAEPAQAVQASPTPEKPKGKSASRVVTVCGTDLHPKPIEWLWRNWLARGKFHLLAGAPGQGKTTLAIAVAATLTLGGIWPDGSRAPRGNVLVWSGEDDPADTLLPRFLAAGGVRERIHFISAVEEQGQTVPFDPSCHMAQLRAEIERIGDVQLLIVDPVVTALKAGTDSHKNSETRRDLQPLVDLAHETGLSLLGITHFAKGGEKVDPAQRVLGSVAFTAVARLVWVAAKTKNDEGKDSRVLALAKSNLGADSGGFEYALEQAQALPGIQASRIAWLKAVEGSAFELLDKGNEKAPSPAIKEAMELLPQLLVSDCWTPAAQVEKDLKAAGISQATANRASRALSVIKRKCKALDGAWYWRLPGGPENLPLPEAQPEPTDEPTEEAI